MEKIIKPIGIEPKINSKSDIKTKTKENKTINAIWMISLSCLFLSMIDSLFGGKRWRYKKDAIKVRIGKSYANIE